MSMTPDRNGAQPSEPSATVQQLREQIAQDRRELSETVAALHEKTDVKAQVQEKIEKAEDKVHEKFETVEDKVQEKFETVEEKVQEKAAAAETALSDLAAQAGRTARSVVRFGRWTAVTAVDQVRNATPRPVREQASRVGGLVQRELRYVIAASTAAVAAVTWRWWREHESR
jgi:chromosome segregation ATPase